MAAEFLTSRLYRESLGANDDHFTDERERLRVAHRGMRDRVAPMAEQIARDLPGFTVHDSTHLDALWVLADVIGGQHVSFNPAEGFLFGASVLLHDLGLAVAAYPGGRDELRSHPTWLNALAVRLRRRRARAPTPDELADPDEDVAQEADEQVLRERHADRAVDLAQISWGLPEDPVYLVEDVKLRQAFAYRAGLIAASHWWSIDQLHELAADVFAPSELPAQWPVDTLKLACLLRLADVAHLDARRAPALRRALQMPTGQSALHWDFQELLARPVAQGDRLRFTSSRPFELARVDAWWLCADALATVDAELRGVDRLLDDVGRPAFAMRGVVDAESPERLKQSIPTQNWEPVDARVWISNIPKLVASLGGRQLYGDDPLVSLREAIQNATDAVRARRYLNADFNEGSVTVKFGEPGDTGRIRVSVRDDGVGMTRSTLTGPLLDFGVSLWHEDTVASVLPGLAATGFEATGQFGIGFFSLFNFGGPVIVRTRFHLASVDETFALTFDRGLDHRAAVRRVAGDERLLEPGTEVTFEIPASTLATDEDEDKDDDDEDDDDEDEDDEDYDWPPRAVLGKLAPTLDVTLRLRTEDDVVSVIEADDWLTLDAEEFLARIGVEASRSESDRLRCVRNGDGTTVGRIVVGTRGQLYTGSKHCLITVGGLVAARRGAFLGVLLGDEPNLARSEARPVATPDALARWASEQAGLWIDGGLSPEQAINTAALVEHYGGDLGDLPICRSVNGPLNRTDLRHWAAERDAIFVWNEVDSDDLPRAGGWTPEFKPGEDTLVIDAIAPQNGPLPTDRRDYFKDKRLIKHVVNSVALAWGLDPTAIWDHAESAEQRIIGSTEIDDVYSYTAKLFVRDQEDLTSRP